mgnify:FL=1
MEKNQIFIKTGTKYKKMTRELLEESNLAELIGDKNKMVGIKPNLVSPSDPANGGTTHPEIVAGILEYLKENGFKNSMILEGSWVGDVLQMHSKCAVTGSFVRTMMWSFMIRRKQKAIQKTAAVWN